MQAGEKEGGVEEERRRGGVKCKGWRVRVVILVSGEIKVEEQV